MQLTSEINAGVPFAIVAGQIRLQVEHGEAGTMLTRLTDADGRDYLRRPNPLWSIELINRQHKHVELDMRTSVPLVRRGNNQVRFVWNDVQIGKSAESVTVKLKLQLSDEKGEIAWNLTVEDVPDEWSVYRVHFPRLDLAVESGNATDALIMPNDRGILYTDPLANMPTGGIHEKLRRRPYPHGSQTMQFLALQREDRLLYVAAHDPVGHLKTFFVGPDKDNELIYVHPYVDTEIHFGEDWVQPFPWITRLLRGDWYDAAQVYRQFAMTASWTQSGPLVEERKTPLWYQKIGLVTLRLMRGPGFEDEDVLAEHAFMGTPMVCHYYMWHQAAFDAKYPFFFPSVPSFRKTIKLLEANDVHVMPYLNSFSGDMHMDAWEEGLKGSAAQVTPSGELDLHVWSQNRTFATMCPGASLPREMMQMNAMRLFENGVSAVYFDEIAMSASWPCYNPAHKHPTGGGSHFVTNTNDSVRRVKEEARGVVDGPVVTTEGCAEPYIAHMDAMLAGNGNRPNAIPLFEVVYHDHVMAFGRYTWTPELVDPKFAGAIESKHAQQFVWGTQFGWSDVPMSSVIQKSPSTASFIRHLAHTWSHNYEFLAQGRMLRPLDLSDQISPITRRWAMAWTDESGTEVPLMPVLNSVWQRADASIGVVLVNITDEPIALTVRLPSVQSKYAEAMRNGTPFTADDRTLSQYYPLPQRTAAELRQVVGDELRKMVADGDSEKGFAVVVPPYSSLVLAMGSEKQYGLV